jgi:hypothetical protein
MLEILWKIFAYGAIGIACVVVGWWGLMFLKIILMEILNFLEANPGAPCPRCKNTDYGRLVKRIEEQGASKEENAQFYHGQSVCWECDYTLTQRSLGTTDDTWLEVQKYMDKEMHGQGPIWPNL